MLIEFDAAYHGLIPYFDRLWGVINGAWSDWNADVPDKVKAKAHSRSRASLIHDFMRDRGVRLAEVDPTVTTVIQQQMFVLIFRPPGLNGAIGIRLKKLDEDGLSRNQPTTQVRKFRNQMALPEVEVDYHLEAGYVIDRLGSGLHSIDLVCPSGDGIYWKAEIIPTGAVQNVANLFPNSEQGALKEVQVRRKSDKQAGEPSAEGGEV